MTSSFSEQDIGVSVISITAIDSKDSDWRSLGTAFAIYQDEDAVYLLTCAHVVTRANASNSVNVKTGDLTLEVAHLGEPNGIDLAVLRVQRRNLGERQFIPLNLSTSGLKGKSIRVPGFFEFGDARTRTMQELEGELDASVKIFSEDQRYQVNAWHLTIKSDYYLQPGYSGSPVIDTETNCVLGIVSYRRDSGQRGLAISIEALEIIYSDIPSQLSSTIKINSSRPSQQTLETQDLPNDWLLTYIGEDQLKKLDDFLVLDLMRPNDRRIQSAYSYWGAGPTQMWLNACGAGGYVMQHSITMFDNCVKPVLSNQLGDARYNFVSLGVGNGRKDQDIIMEFFGKDEEFLYIPVDTSLDMLKEAIKQPFIKRLPLKRRIAVQRDFTEEAGIQEIAKIAKQLGKDRAVLYGFLGNTIANVEDPQEVLKRIVQVMRSEDLLLFEAQIIHPSAFGEQVFPETKRLAEEEYKNDTFRLFAESALKQHCDIPVPASERRKYYVVDVCEENWSQGQLLQINCLFKNISKSPLDIIFLSKKDAQLQPNESIRLIRSRKFPPEVLKRFLQDSGLEIISQNESINNPTIGFGFMVLLLRTCLKR